jgi:hypothetical protein
MIALQREADVLANQQRSLLGDYGDRGEAKLRTEQLKSIPGKERPASSRGTETRLRAREATENARPIGPRAC